MKWKKQEEPKQKVYKKRKESNEDINDTIRQDYKKKTLFCNVEREWEGDITKLEKQ